MKKKKPIRFDFHQIMDDTPENRETMFQGMLAFDEPYLQPGVKRDACPFFLGVTRTGKLAFMTGPDAITSFKYVIAQWIPRNGITRIDLPIHEIRWVRDL